MKLIKFFLYSAVICLTFGLNKAVAGDLSFKTDKVEVNVYPQYQQIADVKNFNILVEFKMLNGWHIAWDNAGDAGTPTQFAWQSSPKLTISRITETAPKKFLYAGILTQYGYDDKAYYLFKVNNSSYRELKLKINWVACKDFCEPAEKEFIIPAPEIGSENVLTSNWKMLYKQAQKTFTERSSTPAYAENKNGFITIIFPYYKFAAEKSEPYFIPYRQEVFASDAEQTVSAQNNGLEIKVKAESEYLIPQKGVLMHADHAINYTVLPLSMYHKYAVLHILLLAFLGGLVLNFMPCVFPILSLKALSLAKNSYGKKQLKNGILYFSGVLCCFTLIAAILYFLRLSGEEAGWGFQLQSPIFIGIMLAVFCLLGLMMLDVIKWHENSALLTFAHRLSGINSFLTGFFAVLIASPCTGPFMGAAIGYAVLQPKAFYFPIFLSLGIGYALPFTLLEIFPAVIKPLLPKSGYWTAVLKKILALPVFLTCIWLGWILYHQLANYETKQADNSVWQPYNTESIRQLITDGQPVFIDFTAKWCITCLMNEKTSLNTESFELWAQKNNISLFKADWTNRNEELATVIKQYGRSGVPLYVYYPPYQKEFVILPQILTLGILKQYLNGEN